MLYLLRFVQLYDFVNAHNPIRYEHEYLSMTPLWRAVTTQYQADQLLLGRFN